MARHFQTALVWLGAAMWLFLGCASSNYTVGHKALAAGQYEQAARHLRLAIAEDYRNAKAIRDMGIVLQHQKKITFAQKFLTLASTRLPHDPLACYYLGLTYEAQGKFDQAADAYRQYTEISPLNKMRREMENRLLVILQKQMEIQTKALLQTENAIDVAAIPEQSLAVLYFVNSGSNAEMDPVQKGLTEMLITDLSQVKSLTVVERARMQQLMEEMGLGMSGLLREDTAPRLGKLLGAANVVQGAITGLADQNLRIDATLAHIKTASLSPAGKINGSLLDFYQLEKNLAFNVIEAMGIRLSREEKDAIQKIPTKNLLAFMSFCRGLDQSDQGNWESARVEFDNAVQQDPGFNMAKTQLNRVEAFSSFTPGIEALGMAGIEMADKGSERRSGESGLVNPTERLAAPSLGLMDRTAANISSGFIPNVESRKPTTESSTAFFGASAPLDIRIRLPLKQ
jgi:TolB-like protein